MGGTGSRVRILAAAMTLSVALLAAGAAHGATPRIVGGTSASNPGWIAYLNISFPDGDSLCGGELISKRTILTAAHCVTADGSTTAVSPSAVTAWVGLDHLSDSGTTPGSASNLIVVHPDYDPVSLDNDVALVMLTNLSDHEPVALGGPGDPAVGSVPAVLGWGITDSGTQVLSDTLLRVAAPILAPSRCSALEPGYDATSKICAGGALGQDSCSGDSGGPLVLAAGTGVASLVGTVAYGSQNCGDGQPSVYQRVTSGSVQPFLRFWTAMPRIESISGSPTVGQPLTLQVTHGALFGTVNDTWDLDADGQFDDATGDTVTLPLDTSWRSVAVRAADGNGDVGAQRITIIPGAPPLGGVWAAIPPSKSAAEGTVIRLTLGHSGAVGAIRATFTQPGFAPVTVTSRTDSGILSIPVPRRSCVGAVANRHTHPLGAERAVADRCELRDPRLRRRHAADRPRRHQAPRRSRDRRADQGPGARLHQADLDERDERPRASAQAVHDHRNHPQGRPARQPQDPEAPEQGPPADQRQVALERLDGGVRRTHGSRSAPAASLKTDGTPLARRPDG